MGYDAHITRADFWPDSPETPITLAEWQAVVAADAELEPLPAMRLTYVRWLGPSTLPDSWLAWDEGRVHTKNPDPALLAKCCHLAQSLGARVQGDDGEVYALGPDGAATCGP
jgi:hypothetical protein